MSKSTSRARPAVKPLTETTALVDCRRLPAREQVAGVATDHQPHQPGRIGSGERPIGGDAAVLQHRHVLAERHHLVQPVRDVEDRHAFSP